MYGNSSAAPTGMKSIRIDVSTVTGRSVLYPYPQLQLGLLLLYYKLFLLFPGLLSRERISGLDVITSIYISLFIQPYKLSWLFSSDAARSLEDASLR